MKLLKNAIYNIVYQVFNVLIPIITVPYISRVLGKEGVGAYSYTNSYAQYFITFGMLGISLYGSRQIAQRKQNKEKMSNDFWNIYSLQLFCTLLATLIYIVIFVFINKNNVYLYLAQSLNILVAIVDISWFFIGYEEMKKVVLRNLTAKVIGIILIFALVKDESDLILYTLILGGSMLVGQVLMWVSLKGRVYIKKPQISEIKKHFLPACSLFMTQLASQIYVLLDKTMLGLITNNAQVGLYENSQKTIKIALTVATSIGVVMLPRMSSLYSQNKLEEFKRLMNKSFSFICLLAFPTYLGIASISDNFSPWFYGEGFSGIESLIKVGAIIIIPICISNVLGMQIMIPIGREKKFTISVLGGLVINLIINLFLIKGYGALGTTISSVVAEFTVTIIQFYYLKDIVNFKIVLKKCIKPLIAAILMYISVVTVSRIMDSSIVNTIILSLIGVIVYSITILLLRHEAISDMKNIIEEKRKKLI